MQRPPKTGYLKERASLSRNKVARLLVSGCTDPEGGQVRRSARGLQVFIGLLTPAIESTYIRFHTCGFWHWHLWAYLFTSIVGKLLWWFIDRRYIQLTVHNQATFPLRCSVQFSLIGSTLLVVLRIRMLLRSRGWLQNTSIYQSILSNVIYHDWVAHMLACVMKYPGWLCTVGILFVPERFNCYQPSGSFLTAECIHFLPRRSDM